MGNCVPNDVQSSRLNFNRKNLKNMYIDDIMGAIIRIQKVLRGYLARKKYKQLLLDKKDKDFVKKLHKFAHDHLKKRRFEFKPFDYGDKPVESHENQIKSLQSADSKIFYFGEW
jgi:hypothetical protein